MHDVITLGSAIIDLFVDTDRHETNNKICYPIDGKFLVKDLKFSTGGGGLNSAVGLSKLGLKVGYLGNIGKDRNAKVIINELRKENINFLGTISKTHTGFSVILDTKEKHRIILTYKGASDHLNFKKIKLKKLKTKWFKFSSMDKDSFKTQENLLTFASKNKIKICFTPSSYQLKNGIKPIRKILKKTDLLILNKEEALMLSKGKNLLKSIYNLGPKIICITDGEHEVVVYDGKNKYKATPPKIKVVERTGAGDAFSSGFLAGLIKKESIESAIKFGIINSTSTIQKYGAKNGLLTWRELIKKANNKSIKIKKEKI